jgi:hypothetical protein
MLLTQTHATMPHRRPVNEYERESGALYRRKRASMVEKTLFDLRSCKESTRKVNIHCIFWMFALHKQSIAEWVLHARETGFPCMSEDAVKKLAQ